MLAIMLAGFAWQAPHFWRNPSHLTPLGIVLGICIVVGVATCLLIDFGRNIRPEQRGFEVIDPDGDNMKSGQNKSN